MRYSLGAAGRPLLRLRGARLAASGRVPSETGGHAGMSEFAQDSVPQLSPGCRLNAPGQPEDLLLIPEGALRLKGPARSIVELCDGKRTLSGIVEELRGRYPSEDAAKMETETVTLLARLRDRGVLECA